MEFPIYRNRFTGRNAVISGAGRGIGRACAVRLSREGADCILCDVSEGDLKDTLSIIEEKGGKAGCFSFDIRNYELSQKTMGNIINKYGQIHILVHSAGIGYEKRFTDITIDEWLRCIDINLNGLVFMTQPILKNMIDNRFGRIINVSSQAGKAGRTLHCHYSASKFGLNGFTQALAMEVAEYGINVNAVCPSRIETAMIENLLKERVEREGKTYQEVKEEYQKAIPVRRLGQPEDVAALVSFLASDEASYLTGELISVSGGRM